MPAKPNRTIAGTGIQKRGRERIAQIIDCAKHVLLNEGYGAFTNRNIAARSGISPGTLTYYFRRKEDLFKALFEEFSVKHAETLARKRNEFPGDGLGAYHALVETLIDEGEDRFTRAYFYHLWAASVFDPFVTELRQEIYERVFDIAVRFIGDAKPDLTAHQKQQKAFIFCVLSEGLIVMLGSHSSLVGGIEDYKSEFRAQAIKLLE